MNAGNLSVYRPWRFLDKPPPRTCEKWRASTWHCLHFFGVQWPSKAGMISIKAFCSNCSMSSLQPLPKSNAIGSHAAGQLVIQLDPLLQRTPLVQSRLLSLLALSSPLPHKVRIRILRKHHSFNTQNYLTAMPNSCY